MPIPSPNKYPPPYTTLSFSPPAPSSPQQIRIDACNNDASSPRLPSSGSRPKKPRSHTFYAIILMIARAGLYIYFGVQLTKNDNEDNLHLLTQYKTSNGIAVLMALAAYCVLGVADKIGLFTSLFCLISIVLDSYFTVITCIQVRDSFMYGSLLPNFASLVLYYAVS